LPGAVFWAAIVLLIWLAAAERFSDPPISEADRFEERDQFGQILHGKIDEEFSIHVFSRGS
jgi:hypothetical protein